MIKKKDTLLITAMLLVALVVLCLSRKPMSKPEPKEEGAPAVMALVVRAGNLEYAPVPLTEDTEITLKQVENDIWNTVHVTPDSIEMAASSCENQDCVLQGIVTRDNLESRLLGGMIICLPNQVMLEMIPMPEVSQEDEP